MLGLLLKMEHRLGGVNNTVHSFVLNRILLLRHGWFYDSGPYIISWFPENPIDIFLVQRLFGKLFGVWILRFQKRFHWHLIIRSLIAHIHQAGCCWLIRIICKELGVFGATHWCAGSEYEISRGSWCLELRIINIRWSICIRYFLFASRTTSSGTALIIILD